MALKSGPALEADKPKRELGDWELEGRAEDRQALEGSAVTSHGHPPRFCAGFYTGKCNALVAPGQGLAFGG